MKRIDDKIKEIERKDRINRLLFIGFIALITAFMAYALFSEKRNSEKNKTIQEQANDLSEEVIEKTNLYVALKATKDSLENSLKPQEYWDHIEEENTVEAYIAYITNDWGIDRSNYLPKAIENLKSSEPEGYRGWLWVGAISSEGTYTSSDIVEVIYRKDAKGDIANSEIQIGDIVRLKTTTNRTTYGRNDKKGKNVSGWRNKTKAFVVNTWKNPKPGNNNFEIEIKYY